MTEQQQQIGRGQETKNMFLKTFRDTSPVDHIFLIVSSIFEGADSEYRCSQVCIPAVFSQFSK